MKNLLALFALGLIVFAGLGWYNNWYQVATEPKASGHQSVNIDINTNKIIDDVQRGIQKVKESRANAANEAPTVETAAPQVQSGLTQVQNTANQAQNAAAQFQNTVSQFQNTTSQLQNTAKQLQNTAVTVTKPVP